MKEKAYYRPTQVRHLKIISPLNLDQESKISPVTLSLRIYQVKLGRGGWGEEGEGEKGVVIEINL